MTKEFSKRIISSIILFPLAIFFIINGLLLFSFFLSFCFLIASYEWHKMCKKKNYYLFGLIFLILSFYSSIKLYNFNNDFGYFLIILIICISTDIGGYIFGKVFKGPKITKISPKKTYSGMIGGYVLSLLSLYIIIFPFFTFIKPFQITIESIFFILSVSTFSQAGDIIISFFKRLSNIKDTGKVIPGHGGLLDRVDGIILAVPVSYLSLIYFN